MIVVSPNTLVRFQKLFSINMLHDFYANKTPQRISILPTEECRQTMRNYKLLFKSKNAGCLVLSGDGELGNMLLQSKSSLKLSFAIQSADPFFINYTNLPLTSTKSIYYFNNLEENVNEDKEKLLHKEGFVYAKDEIVARQPYFNHRFEDGLSTKKLWVEDAEGNEVWEQNIEGGKVDSCPIDLRYEPLGKYVLKGEGGYEFDFYTTHFNPELYVGFIDIYLTDSVTASYDAIQGDGVVSQDYVIRFKNRATRWKYFFVLRNNKASQEDYKVESLKNEILFMEAEDVVLVNGANAKMVVSEKAIPLKEHPVDKFQLKLKKNGKGVVTAINLPTPSIQSIKPQSINDDQNIFSEIYVSI
ncbi:MAG: hypothetical protein AB8B69_24790 [Chitinophagales bacterium]